MTIPQGREAISISQNLITEELQACRIYYEKELELASHKFYHRHNAKSSYDWYSILMFLAMQNSSPKIQLCQKKVIHQPAKDAIKIPRIQDLQDPEFYPTKYVCKIKNLARES